VTDQSQHNETGVTDPLAYYVAEDPDTGEDVVWHGDPADETDRPLALLRRSSIPWSTDAERAAGDALWARTVARTVAVLSTPGEVRVVGRHMSSGAGHYGSPILHGDDPTYEAIAGLGTGSVVRVTVEIVEARPLDLVNPFGHVGKHGGLRSTLCVPCTLCVLCMAERPAGYVGLACGHGRPHTRWVEQGRPARMVCWDAWAPSGCGTQDVTWTGKA